MSVYIIPIQTAILLFPFLAAIITLPYIIKQYRTFGSILPIRVLIVYSFIFYLLCAYFLVILPLPPIEEVVQYTTATMQLIPFASLADFTMHTSLVWNDPSTYWTAFNEPSVYLIVFNIALTIPFGIYLRYYFQCGWKKTLLYSFLLTLSFECLQLSGLLGIYPRPYRLFDVDDLITNTLGGMIGYAITPLFAHFLVSRERMDETAYDRGRKVSPLRRVLAFLFDAICVFGTTFIGVILFSYVMKIKKIEEGLLLVLSIYVLTICFYLWLLPILMHGKTIGKAIVKIKLVNLQGNVPHWYQYLFHFMLLYGLILPIPCYLLYFVLSFLGEGGNIQWIYGIGILLILVLYRLSIIQCLLSLFDKNLLPWYDRIFPMKNESSIARKEENEANAFHDERERNSMI